MRKLSRLRKRKGKGMNVKEKIIIIGKPYAALWAWGGCAIKSKSEKRRYPCSHPQLSLK